MTPSSAFKIKTLAVSAALACAGLVGPPRPKPPCAWGLLRR